MAVTVTLLTDFGNEDSYVAEMKAVLLAIPSVRLIDITHEIPPFDISWGSFQLYRSYRHFPTGTWHLAVVDPGVGSRRACVYVRTKRHHFVGPDNGLMNWAIQHAETEDKAKAKIFEIPVPTQSSRTFHGRDVFSPFIVAAICRRPPKLLAKDSLIGPTAPRCRLVSGGWEGIVIGRDHYGNVITSIPAKGSVEAYLGSKRYRSAPNYASITSKMVAVVAGSHGFWEFACRSGSAWDKLRVKSGAPVRVRNL